MKNLTIFVIVLLQSISSFAQQDGTLDLSFGNAGKVIWDASNQNLEDQAKCLAIQDDDKIILGGHFDNGSLFKFRLSRFNADGSFDGMFNNNGIVPFSNTSHGFGQCITLQPDGKIILAGYSYSYGYSGLLSRFNTDGTLDSTFNVTGQVNAPGGIINELLLDINGNILLLGYTSGFAGFTEDVTLSRYNSSGVLDSAFGNNGIVQTDLGSHEKALGGVLQNDGKILIVGKSYGAILLMRYMPNGELDTTFNGSGYVVTNFGGNLDVAYSVSIQADSKIIVTGDIFYSGTHMALERFFPDGQIDSTFGVNGIVVTELGGVSIGLASAIQNDGKILVGGRAGYGVTTDFAVVRYLTNGNVDSTFGNAGSALVDFGNVDRGWDMKLLSNGKIIVAGATNTINNSYDFAMIRLNNTITGIAEQNAASLQIYPNPTTGVININSSYSKFEILDLLGKVVCTRNAVEPGQINLEKLPCGIYFVRASNHNFKYQTKLLKF